MPPAIFLLAFAMRAGFLLQWLRLPYVDSLCSDAWANDQWALDILKSGLIRHSAFYQSPLYPYFLAAFYKIFGHEPGAVLWVQAGMDSCSCVILMHAAKRCFGTLTGALTGLASALYRPFILSAALLTKETFVLFGAALFLLLSLRAGERGRIRDYFFCGLAAGWTVLSRSNMALLIPAALLWFGLRRSKPDGNCGLTAGAALSLLAGAALAVLPATLHNLSASRDLVLVNYTGGFTFFIGNNPDATGLATYPPGVNSDPLLEESQSTRLAEISSGRALKPSEASSFWFRKGLSFIAEHPFRWLGLTGLKFWLFWNRYEISDNYDIQFISRHFTTILNWPLLSFALIGSLGAAGLFLCRFREPSGLPLLLFLAYLSSILPFLISDRYRLPGVVYLLPIAAAAFERIAAALVKLDWRAVWKLLLPASPLILLCLSRAPINARSDEAAGWGQLAAVYSGRGDFSRSVDAFQRAAALDPGAVNEASIDSAAFSLRMLNRPDEALALYEEGSRIYPESAILYNNRATLLFQLGRTKEGVELLERSLKADPSPGLQYKNLFYGCVKLGQREKAMRYGSAAAARFPEDMELQRGLRELERRTRGSK